jgi:hypothetical protein
LGYLKEVMLANGAFVKNGEVARRIVWSATYWLLVLSVTTNMLLWLKLKQAGLTLGKRAKQ